jgi:hypothetical protein
LYAKNTGLSPGVFIYAIADASQTAQGFARRCSIKIPLVVVQFFAMIARYFSNLLDHGLHCLLRSTVMALARPFSRSTTDKCKAPRR